MFNHQIRRTSNSLLALLLLSIGAQAQDWAPQMASSSSSHFSAVSFVNDRVGWISGAYGQILKTTNAGLTWVWQQSGTGLHFSDQYFISQQVGWVVGQNGVIVKTIDGGATWNAQASGTSAWLNFVQFVDENTGWAAGTGGTVLKTMNGGATWSLQLNSGDEVIEGGEFVNASNGVLACDDGCLLKTSNGGATWVEYTTGTTQGLSSVCFVNTNLGWSCGDNGRILKTTNGGASWNSLSSGTTAKLNAVNFPHPDSGWVVGDGGFIARSTNGGLSWHLQQSITTENLREVEFINPRHGYAVGLNGTVLEYALQHAVPVQLAGFTVRSLGNSRVRLDWRTISEVSNYGFEVERSPGTPEDFTVLSGSFVPGHGTTNEPHEYFYIDNTVQSGRYYYRLKQIDLDGTINYSEHVSVDVLTSVGVVQLPTKFSLEQNYPNPFNPSTQIGFDIARAGFASLKVYDVLGREVAAIVNEELPQGSYVRTFNAGGLSSGVYVYRLTAPGFQQSKRFMLSK